MSRVLLTRPERRSTKSNQIQHLLREAGVEVVELPMLNFSLPREIELLDESLKRLALGEFDLCIISSPTAAEFLDERLQELELAESVKTRAIFGAIGSATREHLALFGYEVTLPVPIHAGATELTAILHSYGVEGKRVLLLQSQIGLEHIEHFLNEAGAYPVRVVLYVTKGPTIADSARLLTMLEGENRPDVVAFFSPSSVTYFVRTLAQMASGMLRELPAIACIGETTAKAIEETLRRRPEIVARKADQGSLAEDILSYLESKGRNGKQLSQ